MAKRFDPRTQELPLPGYVLIQHKKGDILASYVFDRTPAGFQAAKGKAFVMGRSRGFDLRPGFTQKLFKIYGQCLSPKLTDGSFIVLRTANQF